MSKSYRRERSDPREREFSWTPGPNFVPNNTGCGHSADEHGQLVRDLLGTSALDIELEALALISASGR